jgi:hypothetical protein
MMMTKKMKATAMSNRICTRLASPFQSQSGVALPLVIIALLFGSILVLPFLDFARLRFGNIEKVTTEEEAYFVADAGVEAVLADLRKGSDALDGGYVLPAVTLNGYTPVITVTAPPRADMASFGAVFVDPQTATSLNPLGSNASLEYQIDTVQPFADFQISCVYTPSGNNWRLRVYEGVGTGGSLVTTANGNDSPARVTVPPDDVNGGTYTIEFSNQQTGAITSAAFSSVGDPSNTWVRIVAFKDYLIEATAGEQTVTTFARQGPGPNQVQSTVLVSTWHGPN